MRRLIIDRIEGDYAVAELENGSTVDIRIVILPEDIKEGDVVDITINEQETRCRKNVIKKLWNDLLE